MKFLWINYKSVVVALNNTYGFKVLDPNCPISYQKIVEIDNFYQKNMRVTVALYSHQHQILAFKTHFHLSP